MPSRVLASRPSVEKERSAVPPTRGFTPAKDAPRRNPGSEDLGPRRPFNFADVAVFAGGTSCRQAIQRTIGAGSSSSSGDTGEERDRTAPAMEVENALAGLAMSHPETLMPAVTGVSERILSDLRPELELYARDGRRPQGAEMPERMRGLFEELRQPWFGESERDESPAAQAQWMLNTLADPDPGLFNQHMRIHLAYGERVLPELKDEELAARGQTFAASHQDRALVSQQPRQRDIHGWFGQGRPLALFGERGREEVDWNQQAPQADATQTAISQQLAAAMATQMGTPPPAGADRDGQPPIVVPTQADLNPHRARGGQPLTRTFGIGPEPDDPLKMAAREQATISQQLAAAMANPIPGLPVLPGAVTSVAGADSPDVEPLAEPPGPLARFQPPPGHVQPHRRAVNDYRMTHSPWVDEARDKGAPLVAGPSGNMGRLLTLEKYAQTVPTGANPRAEQTQQEIAERTKQYSFAGQAFLAAAGAHSFHETGSIARQYGVPYSTSSALRYNTILPEAFKQANAQDLSEIHQAHPEFSPDVNFQEGRKVKEDGRVYLEMPGSGSEPVRYMLKDRGEEKRPGVSGNQGRVYKARQMTPEGEVGKTVAIKKGKRDPEKYPHYTEADYLKEVDIGLGVMNAREVASTSAAMAVKGGDGDTTRYAVAPWLEGTRLEETMPFLARPKHQHLIEPVFRRILGSVGELNDEHGLIHRDLHPKNVMVGESLDPKIIDYGKTTPVDVATTTMDRNKDAVNIHASFIDRLERTIASNAGSDKDPRALHDNDDYRRLLALRAKHLNMNNIANNPNMRQGLEGDLESKVGTAKEDDYRFEKYSQEWQELLQQVEEARTGGRTEEFSKTVLPFQMPDYREDYDAKLKALDQASLNSLWDDDD